MFCERCGKMNPDGVNNCQSCGAPMAGGNPGAPMQNPQMGNPNMGNANMGNPNMGNPNMGNPNAGNPGFAGAASNVMGKVGGVVNDVAAKATTAVGGKDKKMFIIFGAAAVVIVALVVILVSFVFCGSNGNSDAEELAIDYMTALLEYEEFNDDALNCKHPSIEAATKDKTIEVISIEVEDTSDIDEAQYESYEKTLNERIKKYDSDADKVDIIDMQNIVLEVKFEEDGKTKTEKESVTVYKDKDTDKWYVY